MIRDHEEAQRQQLLTFSDTQPRSHNTNNELSGNNTRASNHLPGIHQASGGDRNHSLFDILAVNTTVRNACITGDLHTAEDLLTQELDADDNNHDSYAIRSVVRARNSQQYLALQDSVMSIVIQPSLFGYISMGIALCGNEKFLDAMEAFDLACVFSDRHPTTVELLLLIKAVALFNVNHHDEAMRRVQGLSTVYQRSDTLSCRVVNLYLRVQLAIIAFEDGRYSEAADQFNECIPCVNDLLSRGALYKPRLNIFTVLFGWNLNSLWETVNQRRCEALLHADRGIEAIESHQYMMRMIDEDANDSYLEWSTVFKQNCTARCLAKGDEAVAARNYLAAVELYSAGIALDSSCESLFGQRSKANLARNLYEEALHDADKVIELNPSSYLGYELKHAALHGAHRYDEAMEAFNTMLLKSDDAPYEQIQKLYQQYASSSEVQGII